MNFLSVRNFYIAHIYMYISVDTNSVSRNDDKDNNLLHP